MLLNLLRYFSVMSKVYTLFVSLQKGWQIQNEYKQLNSCAFFLQL
jgi:hypothetical protein